MWQKALIYFLLLCFFNSAFLPPEKEDIIHFNGETVIEEEYNNLYELVKECFMGEQDNTPEDEDDDIPDWIKKTTSFYFYPTIEIVFQLSLNYKKILTPLLIKNYSSYIEIFSPPPQKA